MNRNQRITSSQRAAMLERQNTINKGPNSYCKVLPYPYPYPYVHYEKITTTTHRVLNMGKKQ